MTSHFNFTVTQEDIDTVRQKLSEIIEVLRDKTPKLSNKQTMYLEDGLKLKGLGLPKKQHKPKHNMPYWAKDWRSKK